MATIKLWKGEVRNHPLPPVCIVCGRNAERETPVRFAWTPPWIWVCLLGGLAGLIGLFIVMLVARKRFRLNAPVCDRHERHWSSRKLFLAFGLVGCVAGLGLAIALTDNPGVAGEGADSLAYMGSFAGLCLVLVVAAYLQRTGVHPTGITDDTMTLKNVSQGFADALEDQRGRDEDEEERRYWERRERRRTRRVVEQTRTTRRPSRYDD